MVKNLWMAELDMALLHTFEKREAIWLPGNYSDTWTANNTVYTLELCNCMLVESFQTDSSGE